MNQGLLNLINYIKLFLGILHRVVICTVNQNSG